MRLYIFSSVSDKYAIPFKLFVINQNLKVARLSSLLIITVCILALVSCLFVDYSGVPNRTQYLYAFTALLATSLLYFIATNYVKRLSIRHRLTLKRFIGTSYPLIIIFGMMWMSFISGRSPADNMTMFMFGLLFVAVSWLFSVRSALTATAITFAGLALGLGYLLDDAETIVVNLFSGAIIVIGFYFISRMLYSYHANYFIQLKQIERNNHEITKIGQLKTEMLGIVAHDLRSPLNSITALVELSKTPGTSLGERDQYSDMILEACNDARNIIRDLILIVKGESAQGLQLKETNLNLLLSQVQQQWSHQVKDKKLLLTLPETIVTASIDQDKMARVFDNLIGNAIKFTEEGATIHLSLLQDKEHITVTVADDGIGIPEDLQPFLFDRFSKAGRLGLKGEKSHGLGLNICKQIVEQHGGK
ncbi:MAG: HAMP domain-containing histidine kinase, partial [Taibaiella sp.]|nr:HAMP domain-containing histidine kinase [Taibaiella sp.]